MVKFVEPPAAKPLSQCYFYHFMDLPEVGTVGGAWDFRGRFDDYLSNEPVAGKTFLDIGAGSGFFSFEAEQRGASVVSFDMDDKRRQHFLPYRGHPCYEDKEAYYTYLNSSYELWKNGFWFAHHAMKSKAKVFHGDVYNLPPDLGRFDIVFAGCIMMHLANPIQALESISRVSADTIIVVDTVDVHNPKPQAYLQSTADNPIGHIIWWVYSEVLYREVFAMLGYDVTSVAQNFYKCHAYFDAAGSVVPTDVLLTTIKAKRRP